MLAFGAFTTSAQCSFTGLDANYCTNDAPVTLVPSGTGTLSGTGVTGTSFDPAAAGPGTHSVTYTEAGDPNVYTVDQTGTFAPVAGSGTAVSLGDDQLSGALPIGFTFTFFGVTYTDFHISSNGFITFTGGGGSGCCSGATLPSGGAPDNLIAFGWEDMYPPGNGTIEYFTAGTAPNRMLVMNFTDIPFCCGSNPEISTQVVLYETSNLIELHTTFANAYSTGTQGIQNVGGTVGFPVTGRNGEAWGPLTNDYVAFIPDGCFVAQTTTVDVNPSISLSANDELFGNDGSVNLTILSGAAPFTFDWDNDGTGDNDDSNDLFNVAGGTYTVTMTDATGCTDTASITVGSQLGLEDLSGLDISIEPNPSTGIFNVNISEIASHESVKLEIVNTAGQRVVSKTLTSESTKVDISTSAAGTYFVKLITESGTTVKQIIKK